MNWQVPLSDLDFGLEEYEAVQRVLKSGWISMGPETELFEREFAEYLGVDHAIAVSSGTAALHLSLAGLGIGPGDEVIVPSLTFCATVNAIVYTGAVPVFADIDGLHDLNISTASIEQRLTSRTRAILVVHYGGFACRMDQITRIADDNGLLLVEDAAHAPGSAFHGRKLGTWGDAGCFSFFSNKNMATAEGGMIATANPELAERLKRLRSHGMTSLTWQRHRGHSFSYDVVETGYNYRMDDIRAALGRVQLAKLEKNNARRREIFGLLREGLAQEQGMAVPFSDCDLNESSCHLFPVILASSNMREGFMAEMKKQGVQTSIHYPPVHRFTYYSRIPSHDIPLTEDAASREVSLPLFPSMTRDQAELTVQAAIHSLKTAHCSKGAVV
ncbi:DegT/DnrJ/EryC1/StrS family aminotransferase [Desulfomonile tiedjei]|uniref:Putative PLP-dependent enzyme possibly involved in cell wall biogenesis n=1 Tax=Desulfomonile tiedjei (strain ATCC 49306 / DSM 6799 / DCB-1) TaxID=706587 RepID=I4CB76_DESTA|nr:DegT/DnrJ/EryC1/StrS family aminotransferase [Desulfomonile tiedjei]AFM26817.1 putative PLP-dependent enzyme possibly involved in cell wall biogenesis [Desulfomonile tiedjei DSM 6799]